MKLTAVLSRMADVGTCMGDCEAPVTHRTGRINPTALVCQIRLPRGIELRLCRVCARDLSDQLVEVLRRLEGAGCHVCDADAPKVCKFCRRPVCARHAVVWTVKHRGGWRDGQTRPRYSVVDVMCRRDCGPRTAL